MNDVPHIGDEIRQAGSKTAKQSVPCPWERKEKKEKYYLIGTKTTRVLEVHSKNGYIIL